MMIHDITEKVGQHKRRRRLGRGEGSGRGKTAGRGYNGARSRSGWSLNPQFEGGQINFIQKLPKRGFNNYNFRKLFHIVNLAAIEKFANQGEEVNAQFLATRGVIRDLSLPLKVLGQGEITKKLTVTAARFSNAARTKLEAAGGTVNELDPSTKSTKRAIKKTETAPAKKQKVKANPPKKAKADKPDESPDP